jgi:hypothetical protein
MATRIPRRPYRRLVPVLLALAVITGFVGTLAVWVNRQAFNTNNWTSTSSRLLADPKIQKAVGTYLVGQVFSSANVSGAVGSVLPKPAAGLSGPLASGLRGLADQVVPELLATDAAQRAWREANRTAHAQLIRIIDGGGSTVSTDQGVVTLDLHPLLEQLIDRSGLLRRVGITLPPRAGQIVIMRSAQLKTAQDVAAGIRGLAVTFTILPLALCALAVFLAAGWRRIVVRRVGWSVLGVGIAVLLARLLLGHWIIDALVSSSSVRGAGTSAWLIGSSMLRNIAIALAVAGAVIVVATWLTPRRSARAALGRPRPG